MNTCLAADHITAATWAHGAVGLVLAALGLALYEMAAERKSDRVDTLAAVATITGTVELATFLTALFTQ